MHEIRAKMYEGDPNLWEKEPKQSFIERLFHIIRGHVSLGISRKGWSIKPLEKAEDALKEGDFSQFLQGLKAHQATKHFFGPSDVDLELRRLTPDMVAEIIEFGKEGDIQTLLDFGFDFEPYQEVIFISGGQAAWNLLGFRKPFFKLSNPDAVPPLDRVWSRFDQETLEFAVLDNDLVSLAEYLVKVVESDPKGSFFHYQAVYSGADSVARYLEEVGFPFSAVSYLRDFVDDNDNSDSVHLLPEMIREIIREGTEEDQQKLIRMGVDVVGYKSFMIDVKGVTKEPADKIPLTDENVLRSIWDDSTDLVERLMFERSAVNHQINGKPIIDHAFGVLSWKVMTFLMLHSAHPPNDSALVRLKSLELNVEGVDRIQHLLDIGFNGTPLVDHAFQHLDWDKMIQLTKMGLTPRDTALQRLKELDFEVDDVIHFTLLCEAGFDGKRID